MANDLPPIFIVDPDRRFTLWNLPELFGYGNDPLEAVYVGNENDLVFDKSTGFMIISSVDYTTGYMQLIEWKFPGAIPGVQDEDIFLGPGPGDSTSWRIYLDTRNFPYRLRVDGRTRIGGEENVYAKLFLGSDITNNGEVISMWYDQGAFQGENIPLELLEIQDSDNRAIKIPKTFYTDRIIPDGQPTTLVVYNLGGVVGYRAKYLIENTDLIRRTEASMRYIESIRLTGPFISASDPSVIEFPINVNIATVVMRGIVRYSDGGEVDLPITFDDSGKFSLFGMQHYVSTIEGDRVPLTLNYRLSEDELSYGSDVTPNGTKTRAYYAVTKPIDYAYSLKLFAYPVWRGDLEGYGLEFYLCNLDRKISYVVPRDLVQLSENSPSFDGLDYISMQWLTFQVNLAALDDRYSNYYHVQSIGISLKRPGSEPGPRWEVKFSTGQQEAYGLNLDCRLRFINANSWRANLKNDLPSKEVWLQRLYYAINPLYDTRSEPFPLEPTHFNLRTHRRSYQFPIDMWDQDLNLLEGSESGTVITIEWLRRLPDTDLVLGVTGLVVSRLVA